MPSNIVWGGGLLEPNCQALRVDYLERTLPAACVIAGEVELDRRDFRLDGAPQRPAHIGHQCEQVHPGELLRVRVSEVGRAQGGAQVLAELGLLRGVSEIKARV